MSGLRAAARAAVKRGRRLLQTERERRIVDWVAAGKDRTLRLDYDLDRNATVLDVGGYMGQWASDIYARFRCRVHIFEPVPEFATAIAKRFARNSDISVHAFGLGSTTRTETISVAGVGSTIFPRPGRSSSRYERVRIVAAAEFLRQAGVSEVSLAKINVEGGEYELLEHLLENELALRFTDLQIQFHDFVPHARERMQAIQRKLALTHQLTWQEEFIWENWHRTGLRAES